MKRTCAALGLLFALALPGAGFAETLGEVVQPAEVWDEAVVDPGCGEVGIAGCCEGANIEFCHFGELAGTHCAKLVPDGSCGWNPALGQYDCGFLGADPAGTHPYACPGKTCAPDCKQRACGSDGCGGSCGTCSAGNVCQFQGYDGTHEVATCQPAPGCGTVPAEGCCEGSATGFGWRCVDGAPILLYCVRNNPPLDLCGWSAADGAYACGGQGDDPGSLHPRTCPGTDPQAGEATGGSGADLGGHSLLGTELVVVDSATLSDAAVLEAAVLADNAVGDADAPSSSGGRCSAVGNGTGVAGIFLVAAGMVFAVLRPGRRTSVVGPGTLSPRNAHPSAR